jgi:hypothetical protein
MVLLCLLLVFLVLGARCMMLGASCKAARVRGLQRPFLSDYTHRLRSSGLLWRTRWQQLPARRCTADGRSSWGRWCRTCSHCPSSGHQPECPPRPAWTPRVVMRRGGGHARGRGQARAGTSEGAGGQGGQGGQGARSGRGRQGIHGQSVGGPAMGRRTVPREHSSRPR